MIYVFDDDYELDLQRYELRYAGKLVRLEPQVFNVLVYLVQHRDRVVSKEELLEQLWPGRFVGESVLTSRLMAARKAVGDSGRQQRIIQTLHGRGYRFVAPVQERGGEPSGEAEQDGPSSPHSQGGLWYDVPPAPGEFPVRDRPILLVGDDARSATPAIPGVGQVVGRRAELAQLHHWLQRALTGTRQVGFVTGETGLGKTTLVEAFIAELGTYGTLWIGLGQCLEHYGAGEAYRPVLEAFGRLCHEPEGQELLALLVHQAPTWVVQMPWLVSDAELERLQRRVLGVTRERMLREMAEAIEVLTAAHPLVLILEDLHWSDASTLALVASLARRQESARLLLLGTYRPAEAMHQNHPLQALKHELHLHRHCEELPLTFLPDAAVGEYLTNRFPGAVLPAGLARLVHQRTNGNPLFMVNVVDYWLTQGVLVKTDAGWTLRESHQEPGLGIPETLRQLIEKQFDRLTPEEQRVLEAASVAGAEFSAAAVAAGLAEDTVRVEDYCEGMARRGLLLQPCEAQIWPDGTVAAGYSFAHTFYHEVIYNRVTAARRVQLHRRIGDREEVGYGIQASAHAAELAVHFERGRDYGRAARYLQYAGENALRRSAYQEATAHLHQGLALLLTLPDTPERSQQELALQITLGAVLGDLKGPAAPEVAQAYTRAWELCQQGAETAQRVPVLLGLGTLSLVRGQFHTACEQAEHALRLAQQAEDALSCAYAHMLLGHALFYLGELDAARTHLEQGLSLYEPRQHRSRSILLAREDPQVFGLARLASILWYLGYPDQALQRSQAALTLARELGHPYSLVMALIFAAGHHQRRREGHKTLILAEEALMIARDQGFALRHAEAMGLRGWALSQQGQGEAGILQLRRGLDAERSAGIGTGQLYRLALLADAYGQTGQISEGLQVLDEALRRVDHYGSRPWVAELQRLKGEFLLVHGTDQGAAAEDCFRQALDIACRRQAKSLEVRAAMSLSRLWRRQGKCDQARVLLAPIYGWFTEGFDTADLREAKALLEKLS